MSTRVCALVAVGVSLTFPCHGEPAPNETAVYEWVSLVHTGPSSRAAFRENPTLASRLSSATTSRADFRPEAPIGAMLTLAHPLPATLTPATAGNSNAGGLATISSPSSFSFGLGLVSVIIAFLRWKWDRTDASHRLH